MLDGGGFEADGAYAPIKYLNGDTSDVIGALLDASVRTGYYAKRGSILSSVFDTLGAARKARPMIPTSMKTATPKTGST